MLTQKVTKVNKIMMSYWEGGKLDSSDCIVLLSPGAACGDFFNENPEYINEFSSEFRLIAPDYPGRGATYEIEQFDSIPLIAQYVIDLLKVLNAKNVNLIGFSFGTAVSNEIVRQNKELNIRKVFLAAPGEYLKVKYRKPINVLLVPAVLSSHVASTYRFFLNKFTPLKYIPERKLKSLDEQLIAILKYAVQYKLPTNTQAVIITLKKDNVVRKGSIGKIKKFYTNHNIYSINYPHDFDVEGIHNDILEIIKKEID